MPFHAELANLTGDDLTVHFVGLWEGFPDSVRRRVELAAGAKKEFDLFLGPAGPVSDFEVRLEDDAGEELEQALFTSVWVAPGTTVVGILDPHPMGWGALQAAGGAAPGGRGKRAFDGKLTHLEPRYLPSRAEGLQVFDLLIWPGPDPAELTGEQTRALARWVEGGGHLVLATNAAAGGHRIRPWTDVAVAGAAAPRMLSSLGAGPFREPLAAVALSPGRGRVWLREPWGPVAVEERRGLGSVTVLGFDPSAAPLDRWPGLPRLWQQVLRRRDLPALAEANPVRHRNARGPSRRRGFDELDFRAVTRSVLTKGTGGLDLPLAGLGLIFVLYLAVIGPGEYLLLRRLDRLRWTWATFPLWVTLFSFVSYAVVASSKSSVALTRHVLVRDLAAGAESFRDELHAGLFVTRSGEHRLAARSPEAFPLPSVDPFDPAPDRQVSGKFYDQSEAAISDRVTKWSFVTGTFLDRSPARGARVEAEVAWHGDNLAGRLAPRLGVDLAGAWLVLAGPTGQPMLVELRDLRDGESVELVRPEVRRADRLSYLSSWLVPPSEFQDLARLLTVETIRGLIADALPRLGPDPHPELDWSSVVAAGGAVFIGWTEDAEDRVALTGPGVENRGIVIYRVAVERASIEAEV